MLRDSQVIILGSGSSINEGIKKGLWSKLANKFTIGINYVYKFFCPTLLCYVDLDFYRDNADELRYIPLIAGIQHPIKVWPNTITFRPSKIYKKDLSNGVYSDDLCGLFALSIASYLIEEGEVYLLGYDFGDSGAVDHQGRPVTHFYQGSVEHWGIGHLAHYKTHDPNEEFGVFVGNGVRIYNVSHISRIDVFPKISYDEFFKRLNKTYHDQTALREEIRHKLEDLREKISSNFAS